jgi:7-cyano-7-deazaguanine reductase
MVDQGYEQNPKRPSEEKYGQKAISEAKLEAWENPQKERDYTISLTVPEFTCLCPRSGFPDFATFYISYIPDQRIVELKSLKLYINRYRNTSISHEDATNRVLDDLVELLSPRWMEVRADFNVRGNIKSVITATFSQKDEKIS